MTAFEILLLIASFLTTVNFGILLVFSIVVMPGIAKLDDAAYLRAFQVMDGIIQDKDPIFYFVWIGAVLVQVACMGLGFKELESLKLAGLIVGTALYLIGQGLTICFNLPRNDRVKGLQISTLDSFTVKANRLHFEDGWNRSNLARTILFGTTALIDLVLLLMTDEP